MWARREPRPRQLPVRSLTHFKTSEPRTNILCFPFADAKFVPLSLPPKPKEFIANRPFVFAIRAPNSVLFMGHVENPTPMTARNEPKADGYNRN